MGIDNPNLDNDFSATLCLLLENSNLGTESIKNGQRIVERFAAESAIAKNRARNEYVSVKKANQCFFDFPKFIHNEKSNLSKILSTIGSVDKAEQFDAQSQQSSREAIQNFEKLDEILRKIERHVLVGFLTEIQTMTVFQLFFISESYR